MNAASTIQTITRRLYASIRYRHGGAARKHDAIDTRRSITNLFERLVSEAVTHGASDDAISSALDEATQKSSEILIKRLHADAPRMLREHKKIRNGFERRLQQRWGQALDLYECVCVCCLEAGEEFYKQHHIKAAADNDAKFEALTLLHGRACMVASEVHGLLRTGHGAGAQARWRTLHELAVVAFVLANQDRDMSERFLLHRYVEQSRDAERYQQHCEALGYEQFSEQEMEQIRQKCAVVLSRYGDAYKHDWGWAKPLFAANERPTFARLEQIVNLEHFRPWFRLASHGIHSGASGAAHIRDFYGRGKMMLAGPSNANLADPGNGTLISLYQVTTAFLLHGRPSSPDVSDLISLRAIAAMLEQAQEAFFEIHHELEAEEATIRSSAEP